MGRKIREKSSVHDRIKNKGFKKSSASGKGITVYKSSGSKSMYLVREPGAPGNPSKDRVWERYSSSGDNPLLGKGKEKA